MERDHTRVDTPSTRPAKILIVEDEFILATNLQEILESLGYVVTGIAASFEATLLYVKQDRPDVVLMDIYLQGSQDGIEAATILGESLQIPVLYLTAYADRRTLARVYASRPFGYLRKPVSEDELVAAITLVLRLNA